MTRTRVVRPSCAAIRPSGVTILELVVAMVILSILLGLVVYVFFYSGKAKGMTEKLDVFHEARMIDFSLSTELKFSSGIIYPVLPDDCLSDSPTVSQLIFRDPLNRVKAIFLTPEKNLVMLNYENIVGSKVAPPIVLGQNVTNFTVVLHPTRVVEYKATIKSGGQEHTIVNQLLPINLL